MITIVSGTPRAGKSRHMQDETIKEFIANHRNIVTSTPVKIKPWVRGGKTGQIGFQEYIRTMAPDFDLPEYKILKGDAERPLIESYGHMLIVSDPDEQRDLFMWRRLKKSGEWVKLPWSEGAQEFDDEIIRASRPQLIITDEAWKVYNSRRWKDTAAVVEFYGRQHGKFGDDWYIVSHSYKDLDVMINRMTQEWHHCVNNGMRRYGMFRQPETFTYRITYEPPAKTAFVVKTVETTLNKLLVQTYDTSGGIAVGGGRDADISRQRKGFHWGYAAAAAVVFVVGAGLFAHSLPYFVHKVFPAVGAASGAAAKSLNDHSQGLMRGLVPPAAMPPPSFTNLAIAHPFVPAVVNAEDKPVEYRAPKPTIRAFYQQDGKYTVLLSDGTEWSDDEVTHVTAHGCTINGTAYRFHYQVEPLLAEAKAVEAFTNQTDNTSTTNENETTPQITPRSLRSALRH